MVPSDTRALLFAFETTVTAYQIRRHSSGTLGACDYSNADQGRASYTRSTSVIRPTDSDVVIEVDKAAHTVLTAWESNYFHRYYGSGSLPALAYDHNEAGVEDEKEPIAGYDYSLRYAEHLAQWKPEARELARRKDEQIRLKLGAELIRRGVAPIDEYLKAKDCRRNQGAKHKGSKEPGNSVASSISRQADLKEAA